MDKSFDPYHRWLGIPPEAQPADHYRLLGIGRFEDDGDVIASAADRQMGHVRTFQAGRHGPLSQRLLNELATAKLCLIDDVRRAKYDETLRAEQQKEPVRPSVAASSTRKPLPVLAGSRATALPAVSTSARRAARKKSSTGLAIGLGGCVIGVAVLLVALLAFKGSRAPEAAVRDPNSPDAEESSSGKKSPSSPVAEKTKLPETDGLSRKRPDERKTPQGEPPPVEPGNEPAAKTPPTTKPDVKKPDVKKPDVKKEDVKKPAPAKDGPAEPPPVVAKIDWKTFSLVKRPPDEADDVAPLPAAKVLAAQRARVLRIFETEINAASSDPDARNNLAKRLISLAEKSEDEAPLFYTLLQQARDVTVELAKPAAFLPIIDWMAETYRIDAFEEKLKAITRAIGMATDPKPLGSLADAAVEVHRQADERQLYDVALRLAKSARTAARKAKDAERTRKIAATVRQAEIKQREHRKAQRALAVLIDRPDDPAAGGAMGRYLAFTLGDWPRGLPLLAKSPETELAELAKRDLARSTSSSSSSSADKTSAMVALADAWFVLAKREGKTGRMHAQIARRARHWYKRALPAQKGIERIKTRKHIDEIDEELGPTSDSVGSP